MPEHRIKFRAGWAFCAIDSDFGDALGLILPVVWAPGIKRPVRLTRRFGRPSIDPAVESIWLELRSVPGLQSMYLNGVDLGPPPAGVFDLTVPLESLEARNELTLVVDAGQVSADLCPGGWGSIALVIAPKAKEGD